MSLDSLLTDYARRPSDQAVALVLADALSDVGDPRGEQIRLELALKNSQGKSPALVRRLSALHEAHRTAWDQVPGGFPRRDRCAWRSYLEYDAYSQPRWSPLRTYRTFRRFMARFTDSRAPVEIFANRWLDGRESGRGYWTQPIARLRPEDQAFALILKRNEVWDRWDRFRPTWTWIRPPKRDEYGALEEALEAAWALTPDAHFQLRWYVDLTWPDSNTRLPFQGQAWYVDGEPHRSHVRLRMDEPQFDLDLRFPFQDPEDPRFLRIVQQMQETLDYAFFPSRWGRWAASKTRPTMKKRKVKVGPIARKAS